MKRKQILFILWFSWLSLRAQSLLIPMDLTQTNHLKAYGAAYFALEQGMTVEWLLNYRGGSFLLRPLQRIQKKCRMMGVSFERISPGETADLRLKIEAENMESMLLEKAPRIAIYTPPNKQPWDDAVTMALTYAEISYQTLWDEAVLQGKLSQYDWLHLHHEDFTGQYGKFYRNYHNAPWYLEQQAYFEAEAARLGFDKVSQLKLAVAEGIETYVLDGGFLFAMCSATDSYDIALSASKTDICESVFDGDPPDPEYSQKIDFSRCFAFENFVIDVNPNVYEFSDIDTSPKERVNPLKGKHDYFALFEFSAKYDPVPCMLTQNHVSIVHNFLGQTTGFVREKIKKAIVIMGEKKDGSEVKYLHGSRGQGTFTFLGGHDPEDYQHFVGDPPTDLSLYPNSPGYRLILNNVLFPAAKKKKQKT